MGDFLSASIGNWKQVLNKFCGALHMKDFESTSVIWDISSDSSSCWLAAVGGVLLLLPFLSPAGGISQLSRVICAVWQPRAGQRTWNLNASPGVRLLNKYWLKVFLGADWSLCPSCWLSEIPQFVFPVDCHFSSNSSSSSSRTQKQFRNASSKVLLKGERFMGKERCQAEGRGQEYLFKHWESKELLRACRMF